MDGPGDRQKLYTRKLITLSVIFLLAGASAGFLVGVSVGWKQCVSFGLNFVKIDNIIDRQLIESAIIQYKSSLGGWSFDERSPFYIGNKTIQNITG